MNFQTYVSTHGFEHLKGKTFYVTQYYYNSQNPLLQNSANIRPTKIKFDDIIDIGEDESLTQAWDIKKLNQYFVIKECYGKKIKNLSLYNRKLHSCVEIFEEDDLAGCLSYYELQLNQQREDILYQFRYIESKHQTDIDLIKSDVSKSIL